MKVTKTVTEKEAERILSKIFSTQKGAKSYSCSVYTKDITAVYWRQYNKIEVSSNKLTKAELKALIE